MSDVKRGVILAHRWTGVAMCVLLAAWFASGVTMLFVGYPKLTPAERLAPLAALPAGCCVAPEAALAHSRASGAVKELTLTSIGGRPRYVLAEGDGTRRAVDGVTGAALPAADAAQALASAQAFVPGARAAYAGAVQEDRWTHGRALDPHRPLHVVEMADDAATRLYVSSATGQVVLDAPRAERGWNYVGAWLHWLYMFRDRPADPVWSWTVIALSFVGVITSVTGLCNGIWRWRFAGRYRNGTRSPFRDLPMRWHHLLGLGFGAVLCTWIFSGLMSMNPLGAFDAARAPDVAAYEGGRPGQVRIGAGVPVALARLASGGFVPVELQWRVLAGQPYLLARDAGNATRLVVDGAGGPAVLRRWPTGELGAAAGRLLPAPVARVDELTAYDGYYYRRGAASMYGGNERRLPVLRVTFGDPGATWIYVDPQTGQMALAADRAQRVGRWLFNLLHSWDAQPLLGAGWLREAVLVALSAGGFALGVTGIAIGTARLTAWWGRGLARRARRVQAAPARSAKFR